MMIIYVHLGFDNLIIVLNRDKIHHTRHNVKK